MELKKLIERVRLSGEAEYHSTGLELAAAVERLLAAHDLGAEQLAHKLGNLLDNEKLSRQAYDAAIKRFADYIAADRLMQRLADADLARGLKYAEGLGSERHQIFNQACDYIAEQIERGGKA